MSRTAVKNLIIITLPVLLVCLLLLELFFRLVIPACEAPFVCYDESYQILRYDNGPEQGTFTIGPFAQQKGRWRINNAGWNSEIDYQFNRTERPLIAVIGDSYIESFQIDVGKNVVAILRDKTKDKFDVYGFGISGASLCDYLQMSRYVLQVFDPEIIIINCCHNDFDESLCQFVTDTRFRCIDLSNQQIKEMPTKPYSISKIKRFFLQSAFLRYLNRNCRIGEMRQRAKLGLRTQETPYSRYNDHFQHYRTEIEQACNYLVAKIAQEKGKSEVLFVIDGPRWELYSGDLQKSQTLQMNNLLRIICDQYSCHFLDLTETMVDYYAKHHQRMETIYDYHWNEIGHKVAAEAMFHKIKQITNTGQE